MNPKKILVITKDIDSEFNIDLKANLNKLGEKDNINYTFSNLRDISIEITDGKDIDVIIDGRSIIDFDLVMLRKWNDQIGKDLILSIAEYLDAKAGHKLLPEGIKDISTSINKIYQAVVFKLNALPIPKTIYLSDLLLKEGFDLLSNKVGLPFILKDSKGTKGEHNYLVNNKDQFLEIVNNHNDINFIAQNFIPHDFDYRIYVYDLKVKLIKKRIRSVEGTHLTNISVGNRFEYVDINAVEPKVLELAINACKAMKRTVAGVDILINQDGNPYIIEVNSSPAFAIGLGTPDLKAFHEYFKENLN